MDPARLSLQQLLRAAAYENDGEKLRELILELSRRYAEREQAEAGQRFDIFAGSPGEYAVWKESVSGIQGAKERMGEIAAAVPGAYFIFHGGSRRVVSVLDNGPAKAPAVSSSEAASG